MHLKKLNGFNFMKILNNFLIIIIKFYKYFVSPYFRSNCRYIPTCSEYFLDSLNINGPFRGFLMGMKRILKCHPIKFLGGGSGFNPAIKFKKGRR